MFDSSYPICFVQAKRENDESKHLKTFIYKFRSPVTKLKYIVRAELHEGEVFTIKFYPSNLKHSDHKYSLLTHKFDVSRIIMTVGEVVVILLKQFPDACFAFYGSPTFDKKRKQLEQGSLNKRYRVYFEFVKRAFGTETFAHFTYFDLNGYLLVNRKHLNVDQKEQEIAQMFIETYQQLPEDISLVLHD
jgi:hypothetical protein